MLNVNPGCLTLSLPWVRVQLPPGVMSHLHGTLQMQLALPTVCGHINS